MHMCAQGFMEEVLVKYESQGILARKLFMEFQRCFELLPLVTVVNNAVMVLHGGLPRNSSTTLAEIAAISHQRIIPCTRGTGSHEDVLFEDLMWSDPTVGPFDSG
jgi:serine/threonine-protein phosphatase 5